MKLSIITINLNNRDGLKRTIDSVISQTFTDYEWIVIDGGSTDGSKELIEQYSDHFAFWVSEPDKGIYNAMNKGIKVTKGDYYLFLNSGDWLADNNVLKDVFLKPIHEDIIFGNQYNITDNTIKPTIFNSDFTFSTLFYSTIPHPCTFIKRTLFVNREYDEKYEIVSDWKFFLECALNNNSFKHIDRFITYFDTTGISSKNIQKQMKEREEIIFSVVPECIHKDINQLYSLKNTFSDQLSEIDTLRKKNRFFHHIVTLNYWILKFFDKILY